MWNELQLSDYEVECVWTKNVDVLVSSCRVSLASISGVRLTHCEVALPHVSHILHPSEPCFPRWRASSTAVVDTNPLTSDDYDQWRLSCCPLFALTSVWKIPFHIDCEPWDPALGNESNASFACSHEMSRLCPAVPYISSFCHSAVARCCSTLCGVAIIEPHLELTPVSVQRYTNSSVFLG